MSPAQEDCDSEFRIVSSVRLAHGKHDLSLAPKCNILKQTQRYESEHPFGTRIALITADRHTRQYDNLASFVTRSPLLDLFYAPTNPIHSYRL